MAILSPPCVLSIAGTDPSGGAGIQADIKTISATGSYAASVITVLVAQNTQLVDAIVNISPQFLKQQLDAVFSDLDIKAIKIGMLHNQSVIDVVSEYIKNYSGVVVIDPVMMAKNGAPLLQPEVMDYLKSTLLSQATLLTPNIPEAEKLLNISISSPAEMESAVKKLSGNYNTNILLKGGHLMNVEQSSDVLYLRETREFKWLHAPKINTKNTHGTGCTLSSAIASYLAQDFSLFDSIRHAKDYLTRALQSASRFNIGKGFGPVDHFYYLREKKHDIRKTKARS